MRAAVLGAAMLACGITSTATGEQAAKPAGGAVAQPDRVVCFSEPVTGSHIKKRICMTESEREARRKADQEAMMRLRGQGSASSSQEGGSGLAR